MSILGEGELLPAQAFALSSGPRFRCLSFSDSRKHMCRQRRFPDLTDGCITVPALPTLCHFLISTAALTTVQCPIRGNYTSEIQPCVRKLLCVLGPSISLPLHHHGILESSPQPCFSRRPQSPETGPAAQRQQPCNFCSCRCNHGNEISRKTFL